MPIASLIIRLKDESSRGISRIGGALAGLAGKANQASTGVSGFAGAVRNGVLQANAITFAIGKASEAVGFLNNQFQQASQLQLQAISTATTFSALTGSSYEESSKFLEGLNKRLSASAATLPGVTQEYKSLASGLSDNLIPAFKNLDGSINLRGLEDSLASFSESYGALTATTTKDFGNTALGLNKALAGASVDELRQIAFFEQNPAILGEIEKRLTSMGKELKDLDVAGRVKLLQETGEKFITSDFRKAANESVDGLIQSFMSSLVDVDTGRFGINRDLNTQLEGTQSVFASLNRGLAALIGPDGLFARIGGVLQSAGINLPDPMLGLMRTIDWFNSGIERVNTALQHAQTFLQSGHSLSETLMALPSFLGLDGIGTFKLTVGAGLITAALGAVGTFALVKSGFVQAAVGAGQFAFSIGGKVIGALRTFGSGIQTAVTSLPGMVRSLNQGAGAAGRFVASLPGKTATGFQNFASGVSRMVVALRGLTVGSVLSGAKTAIMTFAATVKTAGMTMLFSPLGIAIGAIALAGLLIYKYWDPLKNFFSGFFSGLMSGLAPVMPAFQGLGQALMGVLGPALRFVGWLIQPLIGFVKDLFKPVKDTDGQFRSFGETLGKNVAGAIVGTINFVSQLIGAVGDAINGIKNLIDTAQRLPVIGSLLPGEASPPPLAAGPRYKGNFPNNDGFSGRIRNAANGYYGGLMSSLQKEAMHMPVGSELLIANSSETIIPASMMRDYAAIVRAGATPAQRASALSKIQIEYGNTRPVLVKTPEPSVNQNQGVYVGSMPLTINISGGSDNAETIAERVIQTIQRRFEGELDAMMV